MIFNVTFFLPNFGTQSHKCRTFWAASSIPSKYAPSLGLGFMVFSCASPPNWDMKRCQTTLDVSKTTSASISLPRTKGLKGGESWEKQDSLQRAHWTPWSGLYQNNTVQHDRLMEELWAQTLHWVGGQMSSSFLEMVTRRQPKFWLLFV